MKTFVMFLAVAIGAVAGIAASQDAAATAAMATAPPAPTVAVKSEITSVYGTVTAYEPGRSITLEQPDRKAATFAIDRDSKLPSQIATGRRVVVHTVSRPGLEKPLVRKVTMKKLR